MCQGVVGKTDSYKKKEPLLKQDAMARGKNLDIFRFIDAVSRDISPKKSPKVDPTKPRTIKDGTTVSGRQIDTSTRQRSRRLRPTRMGRRTGTNSLRIPLNSSRGTGNLNY